MSAWIVSKRHIDCLVTALINEGHIEEKDCDKIGMMLWSENHRSVNYRYNEKAKTPKYKYSPCLLTDGAVLKQIDCYNYQTCEHPRWKGCRSKMFMNNLYKSIAYKLLKDLCPDYSNAPWGIQGD